MDIVDGKVSNPWSGVSHEVLQSEMNEMIQSNGKPFHFNSNQYKITCTFVLDGLSGDNFRYTDLVLLS
jgi:hypothetical protein